LFCIERESNGIYKKTIFLKPISTALQQRRMVFIDIYKRKGYQS